MYEFGCYIFMAIYLIACIWKKVDYKGDGKMDILCSMWKHHNEQFGFKQSNWLVAFPFFNLGKVGPLWSNSWLAGKTVLAVVAVAVAVGAAAAVAWK